MKVSRILLVVALVVAVAKTDDTLANNEVTDGQQADGRDNASVAKIAVIVTVVTCAIAALLCIGACGFCCYQKCVVEGCSI